MVRKYLLVAASICLAILFSLLLMIGIVKIGLMDGKKIFLLSGSLLVIISLLLVAYFNKSMKIYNIGAFVSVLLNIVLIYNVWEMNSKFDYIRDVLKNDYKYITYNVYVQKKTTTYSNISKLEGRKIGVLDKEFDNIKDSLKDVVDIECKSYNDIDEIEYAILNGEIQSFILNVDELNDVSDSKIMSKVRVIYTDKYKDIE